MMPNIKCDEWLCANNGGGYCELGGSEFLELRIEDGECVSYEPKGGTENATTQNPETSY